MILKDILKDLDVPALSPAVLNSPITMVCSDSRKAVNGSLFVAMPGPKTHGIKFIGDAMKQGSRFIVHAINSSPGPVPAVVTCIPVTDPQKFLAGALKNFYLDPTRRIRLIGITGTNGKTTITYLFESLLKNCGVVGTINHRFGGHVFKAGNTTPGLVENFELLAQMALMKVEYCAMEVSSHALDQKRVDGLDFKYAIFTNLTSDHLDYHKDRESYFLAKSKLFTGLSLGSRALINIDDEYGPRLVTMTKAPVWTYGIKNKADISARNIKLSFNQTQFDLVGPAGKVEITTRLIGMHNIYNILAVAGVAMDEQMTLEEIKAGIENLSLVPGRLERIEAGQDFHVFVDYAHTEDALKNVLSSLRQVSAARLIVVFGCGGDRDKTKRPKMAAMVDQLADVAIVTTDNPRSEDPVQIIQEIVGGFKKLKPEVVIDREEAIALALQMAEKGDVVLIAGKGHEDYQIFKDRTIRFDEREVVRKHIVNAMSK